MQKYTHEDIFQDTGFCSEHLETAEVFHKKGLI